MDLRRVVISWVIVCFSVNSESFKVLKVLNLRSFDSVSSLYIKCYNVVYRIFPGGFSE